MGMRIKQLPPAVANQIAAGEVIERPASVVKELLENALDAGASQIHIEVGHGGLNLIRISDNGSGILAEDLPLAVAAHATSKISQLDDLYALNSMGFRGEALASIASVSKLSIISKTAIEDHATHLEVLGSELKLGPSARNIGTTIDVVDLFFNAPVRKQFLKTEKQEFLAIESVVKRFALSANHIAIQLKHNGRLILSLAEAKSEQSKIQRVAKIFGQAFIKESCYFEVEHGAMRLSGWVSGNGCQRSQNDRQWVYINQRMVKDKLLFHAIKQAYEGILHPGRFPACLLYFHLNTQEVDVNVHPTKHEVRFQQPRIVHDFFMTHISQALKPAVKELAPTIVPAKPVEEPLSYHLNESRPIFHTDASWLVLNNHYGIIFKANTPYLVDMKGLYQEGLRSYLLQQSLPLVSRPLLIPLRYPIPDGREACIPKIQKMLQDWGICLNIDRDFFKVATIPIAVPQLDIPALLEAVYRDELADQRMLEYLTTHQFFDARQLTVDEKNELYITLENIGAETSSFCKELTLDDCRKWLKSFV